MNRTVLKKSAVIVGYGRNGLGVTRSLAMDQIPCIGLDKHSMNPSLKTNTCKVLTVDRWAKDAVISKLKAIGKGLSYRAPLIITKEKPVFWVSEAREELNEFYKINLPPHDVLMCLLNKQRFLDRCIHEGWPMPLTWVVNSDEKLKLYSSEIVFPCILKPATKLYKKSNSPPRKAFIIRNKDQLFEVYRLVSQWQNEVVIQEWIEGKDDRIAFCLAYYNRNGEPLALYAGRKIRQYPIKCGNTAIAEPAPSDWVEPLIETTKSIFKKMEFKGFGSIEYKVRKNNDQLVIMEPTAGRTNYQSEIAVINGHNIPAIGYYDLIDSQHIPRPVDSKKVKLICGIREFKAAWQYWRSNDLTIGQWIRDRSGEKKYMLFRSSDPMPFIWSLFRSFFRLMTRFIRSAIGEKTLKKMHS